MLTGHRMEIKTKFEDETVYVEYCAEGPIVLDGDFTLSELILLVEEFKEFERRSIMAKNYEKANEYLEYQNRVLRKQVKELQDALTSLGDQSVKEIDTLEAGLVNEMHDACSLSLQIKKLEIKLSPTQWGQAENVAWHNNLPDVVKAFRALRDC